MGVTTAPVDGSGACPAWTTRVAKREFKVVFSDIAGLVDLGVIGAR